MDFDEITQSFFTIDGDIGYVDEMYYLDGMVHDQIGSERIRAITQALNRDRVGAVEIREKYRQMRPSGSDPSRIPTEQNPSGAGRPRKPSDMTAHYQRGPQGQTRPDEGIPRFSFGNKKRR